MTVPAAVTCGVLCRFRARSRSMVDIAFIGAGGIARGQHFDNVEEMDRVDVVGICDVDEDAATSAAERFDADAFTDHDRLLETLDVDAVFVCLPPFAHGDPELAAVEHGADLFVEKPLALSNDTAGEIRAAIDDAGVVSQVGYNWRYSPGVDRAREILDGRSLGYVEGYWWGGVPGGEGHWWRHYDRSGGQTVEQATHIFDACRFLGGDVERVTAAGSHRIEDLVDFPDTVASTVEHDTGVVSHVSNTCAAEDGKVHLEIVAEGATLEVSQHHVAGVVDGEEIDESLEASPYALEVEDFLDAVEAGDPSAVRTPYGDAVGSLALTLAVNEAVETGETVVPGA
jgi:predicted dehydrogenase